MEGTNGIGLGDAMLLANQNKDGFGGTGGGWFFWVIILFWLMAGNGGWGNNGNTQQMAAELSAANTRAAVWQSNDQQNMMSAIGQVRDGNITLGNGIADATFALNNAINNGFTGVMRDQFSMQQTMSGGFNNVAQAINENRFATQQGFCGVNNAIQGVNYNNAINTCAIEKTSTANTQAILDKLSAMEANAKDAEIANLRQELASAQLAYSQQAQNAAIINAVRPFPGPAYVVSSPYGATTCNCGVTA